MHSDNSKIQINQETLDIDLTSLERGAKSLFESLDCLSHQIRSLEKKMSDIKAHFPFKKMVFEEITSTYLKMEDRHTSCPGNPLGCTLKTFWYLAWQEDETSNKFRLFLISEKKEIVTSEVDADQYCESEISTELLSKKPLIETNLANRAKFGQYLGTFIDEFTQHIHSLNATLFGVVNFSGLSYF